MSSLFKIRTNIGAMRAYHILTRINERILNVAERISTGKKINRASDSPSAYYVARTMQLDIHRLENVQYSLDRGINWLQSNDSRLSQVLDLLEEMYEVTSQSVAGGVTSSERIALQIDLDGFASEVGKILQSGVTPTLYSGFTLGNLENVSLSGSCSRTRRRAGPSALISTTKIRRSLAIRSLVSMASRSPSGDHR